MNRRVWPLLGRYFKRVAATAGVKAMRGGGPCGSRLSDFLDWRCQIEVAFRLRV